MFFAFTKTNHLLSTWFPTAETGNMIVEQMSPLFKSGVSIIEDGDIQVYLGIYLASIIFFMINFYFWRFFWKMSGSLQYTERDDDKKTLLILMWMEQSHHGLVPFLALWNLYVSCGNEKGWPWLSEQGGSFTSLNSDQRWGYFKSDVCFMEYNKGYGMLLAFTNGYLTWSYYVIATMFKKKTKLHIQTEWHHIVSFSGFTCTMLAGYSFPGNANYTLMCEISSLFLNYKDMFPKETRMSLFGQLNQLAFFFSYTITRMIPMPWIVYRCFVQMITTIHLVSQFRKVIIVIAFVQALFIWLLNVYWFTLILKGLKRLLEENGILPKPIDDKFYNDLDEVEHNSKSYKTQEKQD